jgi:hypothetical protein
MNNKILVLIILILLFLFRKPKQQTGTTEVFPLVTSYRTPEGEVFFAFSINDIWRQVSATKSEQMEVGNFIIKSKPTPNGGYMLEIDLRGDVSTYYADKEGVTI